MTIRVFAVDNHKSQRIFPPGMRFSHGADCHLGGHRDPRLRALGERSFASFIDSSIGESVDFILISGDLFNTAIPGIDALKVAVTHLSKAREAGIPVYAIPGSHDFSPSGKTMLDVLERAGLLVNVAKGVTNENILTLDLTHDEKTGVKLCGIQGLRGVLDKRLYEELNHSIGQVEGEKIFLFHTPILELGNTPEMGAQPLRMLPKGFSYYAGGHVHTITHYQSPEYPHVVYPGPLFPNSFSEIETLHHGNYAFYDNGTVHMRPIALLPVHAYRIDVNGLSATKAAEKIKNETSQNNTEGHIVTLRIYGILDSGDITDIDIRGISDEIERRGAYAVLKNTSDLQSKIFNEEEEAIQETSDVEANIIEDHRDQLQIEGVDGTTLVKAMMQILGREPNDGEKLYEYRDTIVAQAMSLLEEEKKKPTKPL